MTRYVALLRGINVGGRNLIRMPALKACFEAEGYRAVSTYIQSGNVIFSARGSARALEPRIEAMLGASFDYRATVVLRTLEQMNGIVADAPAGFGTDSARYRYDVIFLKSPLTAAAALARVPTAAGVDASYAGDGVLYFSRLISAAARSRLNRIVALPIYQSMTIRNWNTTSRLRQLMEGEQA